MPQDFVRTRVMSYDLLTDVITEPIPNGPIPAPRHAMVMVRMHQWPIGVVHVESCAEREMLVEHIVHAAWENLHDDILGHLQHDGIPSPSSAEELTTYIQRGFRCTNELCSEGDSEGANSASLPHVTVCLPTVGNVACCVETVRTILQLCYPRTEVVVVDNTPDAPDDELKKAFHTQFSHATNLFLVHEPRKGSSFARNAGLAAAKGDIIAYVDDDVRVDRAWLSAIVRRFQEDERVACVTGAILTSEIETPAQAWLEQYGGYHKGFQVQRYDLKEFARDEPLYPYDAGRFGSGANAAFRTSALRKLGGFHIALGAGVPAHGGEDIDVLHRIVKSGFQLVYEPAAIVWHAHRRSYLALRRQMFRYGAGLSAMVTSWITRNPLVLFSILRRTPSALRYVTSPESQKNSRKTVLFPRQLSLLELMGILLGPFLYVRSKVVTSWRRWRYTEGSHAHTLERLIPRVVGVFIPLLAVLWCFYATKDVNAEHADSLGIISLMPLSYFFSAGLLSVSFALRLRRRHLDTLVMGAHVVALIFILHGIVSWIEEVPRFPVTYTHVGLSEVIQRTGDTVTILDARMSWPGFFSAAAMLAMLAGASNIYPFLLWAPLGFNLLYAPLVFSLARALSDDRRVAWLSTWLFFLLCWIGQDYFSPQATNFLLYLTMMALIATYFRTDHIRYPGIIQWIFDKCMPIVNFVARNKVRHPGAPDPLPLASRHYIGMLFTFALLSAATVMSHQLTPVFLLIALFAFAILRRSSLRSIPYILLLFFFTYLSFGALGFWSGHMQQLFGGIGNVSSVAQDNVGSKVESGGHHAYVIYGRLLFAVTVWAMALFGAWRRLHSGRTDVFALIGLLCPFLVLGGQSYGGEAILRVFLFQLPFASLLISFAVLPSDRTSLTNKLSAVLASVLVLTLPVFLLARFGNEQFEYISPNELTGIERMYDTVAPGAALFALDGNSSWQYRYIEQHSFSSVTTRNLPPTADAIAELLNDSVDKDPYFFITRSMIENLVVTTGKPANFGNTLIDELITKKHFTVVFRTPDAALLRPPNATNEYAQVPQ